MSELRGLTSGTFAYGRGFTDVVPVADPAAGAGFTYTVGATYWERISSLAFTLVSDGNAANRQVTVTVKDSEPVALATVAAGGVQAASLTRTYSFVWNVGTANALAGTAFVAQAPFLIMQTGFQVVVSIANVQVGDQLSLIRFYMERFQTGRDGFPLGTVPDADADNPNELLGI
jgi:hypothetical protein